MSKLHNKKRKRKRKRLINHAPCRIIKMFSILVLQLPSLPFTLLLFLLILRNVIENETSPSQRLPCVLFCYLSTLSLKSYIIHQSGTEIQLTGNYYLKQI